MSAAVFMAANVAFASDTPKTIVAPVFKTVV
jgi:hypothetical protein